MNLANNSGKQKFQILQHMAVRFVGCSDRTISMTLEHARLCLEILENKRNLKILLLAHGRAAISNLGQIQRGQAWPWN